MKKDITIWKYPIDTSFCTCGNKVVEYPAATCSNHEVHQPHQEEE